MLAKTRECDRIRPVAPGSSLLRTAADSNHVVTWKSVGPAHLGRRKRLASQRPLNTNSPHVPAAIPDTYMLELRPWQFLFENPCL